MLNRIEITEKHLVELVGVDDKPIPSELHLQKELFILSNMMPNLKDVFNFKKHYQGPFSEGIHDSLDAPVYYEDFFIRRNEKIILSPDCKKELKKIFEKETPELIVALKMIRSLYDKLTKNEFMFLIYSTFPEFTEKSNMSDGLLKDRTTKKTILNSLLNQGIITKERYEELM